MSPADVSGREDREDRLFRQQLEQVAPQLREQGVVPPRDLWPDVAAAIEAVQPLRPRRDRGSAWPRRVAALAACLLLLAGIGLVDRQTDSPFVAGIVQSAADPVLSGCDAVDRALAELNAALALAPDDANLSRLLLMLHRTRGRVLRDRITQTNLAPVSPHAATGDGLRQGS